ncbi:MAG: hypothetical protein GPJ54_05270 [Candidatus Heimdallarchaeota archaeon]|nr:hypothetical protein [Candidatus Heimdallarchaeota archaeon]
MSWIIEVLSSRLDSLRNSIRNLERKKLIAILVILLLLISILLSITVYQFNKNSSKKALEEAEFTIDSFDILNGTKEEIWIEFRLNITNFDGSGDSSLVKVDFIEIVLFNNSVELAEIIVPLDSSEIEKSKIIQTRLPLEESDTSAANSLIRGLVNNILSGNNFILDFTGTVYYDVGRVFSDSLKFSNQLLFVVNDTSLDLEIIEIVLEDLNSISTKLDIQITNPFSTEFYIDGTVFTNIEEINLGEINLDNGLLVKSGMHNYTVDWELAALPEIVISELLKNIDSAIVLKTILSLQINDLTIEISPDLELSFGESLVDFAIIEVTNFESNQTSGTFTVEFDMELTSNIPIILNITSILMTFTTISDVEIGVLDYSNQDVVSIPLYSSVIINNVSVIFSDISATTLITVLIDQAIKVPNAILTLQFFEEEIEIEFELERIDF